MSRFVPLLEPFNESLEGPFVYSGWFRWLLLQGKHVAAARGVVIAVAPRRLTLRLWRPLNEHLTTLYGGRATSLGALGKGKCEQQQQPTGLWRVDSDSAVTLAPRLRGNIVQLLANGGPRTARIRELVRELSSGLPPLTIFCKLTHTNTHAQIQIKNTLQNSLSLTHKRTLSHTHAHTNIHSNQTLPRS